ncbi:MAG: hypothetical protein JSR78_10920 [Proteobacteria bacterium]|nr:hypothetical protein [Pseudomonadota bacterium]
MGTIAKVYAAWSSDADQANNGDAHGFNGGGEVHGDGAAAGLIHIELGWTAPVVARLA